MEPRARRSWHGEPNRTAKFATMKCSTDQDRLAVGTLVAAIARSPIVAPSSVGRLPAGFDDIDVIILDWIAAEGRRIGRGFAAM